MQFRYTLGRSLDSTELSPDLTFLDSTKWNPISYDAEFAFVFGFPDLRFKLNNSGTNWISYIESNATVFLKGHKYRVEFQIENITPLPNESFSIEFFVGNQSFSDSHFVHPVDGVYSFDVWCVADSKIVIKGTADADILGAPFVLYHLKYVSVKEWLWNPVLNYTQQTNPKFRIEKSELFKEMNVDYLDNVEFYSDGRAYILGLNQNDVIETKVEYKLSTDTTWKEYYGLIFVNECEFKRDHVIAKIENAAQYLLRKNQNNTWNWIEKLYRDQSYLGWDWNYGRNSRIEYQVFDIVSGAYYPNNCRGFNIFCLLRDIIRNNTNGYVDLESTYFDIGGTFEYLAYLTGYFIQNSFTGGFVSMLSYKTEIVFSDFFNMLDNIFCLGIKSRRSNGVNYVKIEPRNNLRSLTSKTYSGITNDIWNYDTSTQYDLIKCGFQYGWQLQIQEVKNYESLGKSSENRLEIVNNCSRNSTLINTLITTFDPTILQTYFLIQYEKVGGVFQAKQTAGIDDVAYGYNYDLQTDLIMTRWGDVLVCDYKRIDKNYTVVAGAETLYRIFKDIEIPMVIGDISDLIDNTYTKFIFTNSFENLALAYIDNVEIDLVKQILKGDIRG